MTWVTYKLGDVCEIARGGSPRPIDKFITEEDDGINWIKIGDATRSKKYIYETKEKIKKEGITSSRVVNDGDFLLSNSMSFGRPYIMRTTGCVHDGWLVLSRYQKNLDIDFFYHLLSSPVVVNQFENLAQGATVRNLNKELVSRVKVNIPPLPIQQKIVTKLDAIFAEIDKATAAAEANAKNAEALYKSFLINFFTKKIDDSKIFNLSDLCLTLHQGLNTAGEKVKFYDSGFPIIQTRNIDNGIIDVSDKLKFLSKEDYGKYKDKFKPEIGDVFFTNIGTIGKTAIVTNMEDYLIHWNIFKIRPKFNLITSKFMKLALDYLTLSDYFSDRQKGGTVEFVTKKMISEVSLSIPSVKSQIELTNKNDSIFEFCEILRESYLNKLNEIKRLKNSILQRAFSGELVKD